MYGISFEHLPIVSKKKAPKIEFSFQDLGVEMQPFFPKEERPRMWSLFYKPKFTEQKIREAFKVCQKKDIHSVSYLQGVLKRM